MKPTYRLVVSLIGGVPLALLPVFLGEAYWQVWLLYLGAVLMLGGLDAIRAVGPRDLRVDVSHPRLLYIGEQDQVEVVIFPLGRRCPNRIEIRCSFSEHFKPQPLRVLSGSRSDPIRTSVSLVPRRRGTGGMNCLWLRWKGPLGLIGRQTRSYVGAEIPIVPNIRAVRGAALRFHSRHHFLSGIKVEHYVGDGSEFEALREYVPGYDYRAIHWKASARHRKILCREFRAERNHQVVLAFDTGRLMSETTGGIPKLDHAINSGLLLAYFSARSGDRIGLYGFDEKVRAYVAPQGGMGAFRRLQLVTAGLEYSHAEPNFTLGLAELSTRLSRRSLVVLLTDFTDTVTAELMLDNLGRLSKHHLVLFVTLRDPDLGALIDQSPTSVREMARAVVASDLAREREVVLRRLVRMGIHVVDAVPSRVSIDIINRYLDIKRRELIA